MGALRLPPPLESGKRPLSVPPDGNAPLSALAAMTTANAGSGPLIVELSALRHALADFDPVPAMEAAFRASSEGRAVVPPGGELLFDDPPGDAHIKFGYLRNGAYFVVKVVAGFYENARRGLPSTTGLVLLLSQETGMPVAVLLDEGWLTNLRTAAAGAVAAKYLAPGAVRAIGVLGTGAQARMQVELLRGVTPCRELVAWGRNADNLARYCREMTVQGYRVTPVSSPGAVAAEANLIVTATSALEPLLQAEQIRPGTHITAIGADTAEKNELDPRILGLADIVVVDSLSQAAERGEVGHALKAGTIVPQKLVELGQVIGDPRRGRQSDGQTTVVDLAGVAVQDVVIAEAAMEALQRLTRR